MLTEKQLIDRLKSGDTQSLKKIMDLHQDYVYTLVIQMVKLKDVAEELTQDVFIKVYNKINSYEERSKFTTWLYTITYRTCLNYLDKKKIVFNISELNTGTNETDISKNEELLNTKHPDILNDSFDREEKTEHIMGNNRSSSVTSGNNYYTSLSAAFQHPRNK